MCLKLSLQPPHQSTLAISNPTRVCAFNKSHTCLNGFNSHNKTTSFLLLQPQARDCPTHACFAQDSACLGLLQQLLLPVLPQLLPGRLISHGIDVSISHVQHRGAQLLLRPAPHPSAWLVYPMLGSDAR